MTAYVPFAKLEALSLRPLCCLLSALTLFGCLLEISQRKPLRPGDRLRLGFRLPRSPSSLFSQCGCLFLWGHHASQIAVKVEPTGTRRQRSLV
jgi:hypothetical protein